MNRTHNNNEFRMSHIGESVMVRGWVSKVRNLGGLIFIDLRDREGIVQLVVHPENKYYDEAVKLRSEFVLYAKGKVIERSSKNPNLPTGDIEIDVEYLEILNDSLTPMFTIADETDALEETRMKYRYLDLRRPSINSRLKTRSKIASVIRNYLDENDFIEVETPILAKSTPEGARDYLVPSRVHDGEFYALPQSPQIFKQLLMLGGIERYYQIAKCFRDEDLRADRQPEFTQVDIEASFVNEEDIKTLTNNLFVKLFKDILDYDLTEIAEMKYVDAMNMYGSDKPDLRFDMKLNDISNIFADSEFKVFADAVSNGGSIRTVVAKNAADKFSRKDIENIEKEVKKYGAKGLAWLKYSEGSFNGPIAKFVLDTHQEKLVSMLDLADGDVLFIVADKNKVVFDSLGFLRVKLANVLGLIDPNDFKALWVTEFPLFEYDEELNRYFAAHHPFTSPNSESIELMSSDPSKCTARAYDFVINGYEVCGGSIRIHNQDMQDLMFKTLGFTKESAYEQFGFFLDALKYGTPPHGGIAMGLDRIAMIFTNTDNIKDVIAFPKTQSARCLLMDAPSVVSDVQLDDLHISVKK